MAGGYIATRSPALRLYTSPFSISKDVSCTIDRTINTPLVNLIVSLTMLSESGIKEL